VPESTYVINELSAVRLPWLVRLQLNRVRRQRRTGLLLYGMIRTAARSRSKYAPVVSVREGRHLLCMCSNTSKFPKWVNLGPGLHDLGFLAGTRRTSSSFDRSFNLNDGDVLVAICEPIQSKLVFAQRQPANLWYLGILGSAQTGP
jgi:hypothetical protein